MVAIKIGIVGDPQYADTEDGHTFDKSVVRRHRQSLHILKQAKDFFEVEDVKICIILGDLLDGKVCLS